MSLRRWEPFSELMSLRQVMDRLFEDSFVRPSAWLGSMWEAAQGLAVDMYQTEADLVIKTALPGVKPEEVDISITGDTVSISGEHKAEEELREENYFRRERRYGSFQRSLQLPVAVDSNKAEATFENGILTLRIPKREEAKRKQIKVKPVARLEGGKSSLPSKK